ncbi:MAG: alpha/beta fold hydrolase [Betaproteobacteria bacterium]
MMQASFFLRWRWRLVIGTTLAAAVVVLGSCDLSPERAGRLAMHECRLPKLPLAVQCGELEVPENRSQPNGRRIRIAVAVLTANTRNPALDPFVILAGGPGQAASSLGPFAAQFAAIRRHRDIVLVDQRGTGRSSPLECAAFKAVDASDAAMELDPAPRVAECAKELAVHGVDAAQYTTAAWIADLDAIRAALGYERLNLWGGSYGTRAALEYLRRYPQHVRTLVLDGVAPPALEISLDVWVTRDAAISAVFDACRKSSVCQAAHPDLDATLRGIDDALGTDGRDIMIADPRTGAARTLHFTLDHVIAALQPLVYLPEVASLVPAALGRAANGDFAPLYAAASWLTTGLVEQVNAALYYSVTCAEDGPRISPAEREAKLAGLRSRRLAQRALAACDAWPAGQAPSDSATPVVSDAPTLILSGGLDPVTPPAYGAEVAKSLHHSRHIVAAGYGHNVSPHACAPRLIAAFIDDADVAKLPTACVEHLEKSARPALWPGSLAPQP